MYIYTIKAKKSGLFLKKLLPAFYIFIVLFFSCKTTKINISSDISETDTSKQSEKASTDHLTLVFAGDIMAHTPNFKMEDYSKIWKEVSFITSNSDYTFGNIEAPVNDEIECTSYPAFNMHSDYIRETINAGFNVFTVANNHTNDYYEEGILSTKETFTKLENEFKTAKRPVYWTGLRKERDKDFSYSKIEKQNWKIIFMGVTQILNRPQYASYINYVPDTPKEKEKFLSTIKKIKSENPADLFILGLHTNEPEYISKVTENQEKWYNEILEAGVDIIWANHAHVIKKQKILTNKDSGKNDKLIMYGNGNTISGQRTAPNLDLHFTERDDTGDGLIFKIEIEKSSESQKPYITKAERYFITTYINTAWQFVLRPLDETFVSYCRETRPSWSPYIIRRKEICENIKLQIEEY